MSIANREQQLYTRSGDSNQEQPDVILPTFTILDRALNTCLVITQVLMLSKHIYNNIFYTFSHILCAT